MEVDRPCSPTSGDESSGDDDEQELEQYVPSHRQQRGVPDTSRVPHALEVQALFPSNHDRSEALLYAPNWSSAGSDGDEDEIDGEVEVSAAWSGPLNPAKHRMSIYY